VKVGRPYAITENPYGDGSQLFNVGNYQRSAAVPGGSDNPESAFAPGTISVTAHVSVSFVLE
jgi:hypothetical protein